MNTLKNIGTIAIITMFLFFNYVVVRTPQISTVTTVQPREDKPVEDTIAAGAESESTEGSKIPWYPIGVGTFLIAGLIMIGVGIYLLIMATK